MQVLQEKEASQFFLPEPGSLQRLFSCQEEHHQDGQSSERRGLAGYFERG